jgi:glycosyltransferase involved in cell wall biosynthesis
MSTASLKHEARTRVLPVSVVIPAYNRERALARALESVTAQRPHRPAEVIVVDDYSSDRTSAVARRAGARVIRHSRNRGAAAARNTGIRAARWPWIALLDSDDEWLPHLLAELWPLRDDHVLVAGAALGCGSDPADDRLVSWWSPTVRTLDTPASLVYPENYISASGVLVERRGVLEAGGYREDLRYAEDLDLLIRLLDRRSGVCSPAVVARWHRHGEQKSGHTSGPAEAARSIVESYAGRSWWRRSLLERRLGVRAWDDLRTALRQDDRFGALRHGVALLRHPQRLLGLAGILVWRFRMRRRSARVCRDGRVSR